MFWFKSCPTTGFSPASSSRCFYRPAFVVAMVPTNVGWSNPSSSLKIALLMLFRAGHLQLGFAVLTLRGIAYTTFVAYH